MGEKQKDPQTDALLYEGQHSVGVWTLKIKNNCAELQYLRMFVFLDINDLSLNPSDDNLNEIIKLYWEVT